MDAKKCDICGAFYMPYNNKSNDIEPNGFRLLRDEDGRVRILDRYKCCPNCMNKILEFVASLKDHTDDVNGQAECNLDNSLDILEKAGIAHEKD